MSALRVRDLAVQRGGRVVFSGLSFAVADGGALLLRGPNGVGKSTLLRLLAGLTPPLSGAVLWDDVPAFRDRAEHAARIAWVGHAAAVSPLLTAREQLTFQAALMGETTATTVATAVAAALEAFALTALTARRGRLLSAGQTRRVALARLLLAVRPLWLLDEPVTALDAAGRAALIAVIAAHRARGGMVVLASHEALPLPDARALDLRSNAP